MARSCCALVGARCASSRRSSTRDGRKLPARYVLRGDHEVGFALEGYDRSARLLIDPVLSYSTYLGGSDEDSAIWSDVDKAGNFYVTGFTASPDFPTTPGAYRQEDLPGGDVFITKLNRSGSGLVWSTYLGGDGDEAALGLDVNHAGNVVVTGDTTSTDFPTTRGAYQRTRAGDNDAFVTKLDRSGSRLDWSTLLGGSGDGYGVHLVLRPYRRRLRRGPDELGGLTRPRAGRSRPRTAAASSTAS